jgi:hypothetical protein
MKTIYHILYYYRGEWKKTYFGRLYNTDLKLWYFDTIQDAIKDIKDTHEEQKRNGKKKLTKYRIVEKTFHSKYYDIDGTEII